MIRIEGDVMGPNPFRTAEILQGLDESQLAQLAAIARTQSYRAGECLFLIGDAADRLFIVMSGRIELTFPLTLRGAPRDVCVETKGAGAALGWSALVKPYRFTLSGRAAEAAQVASFAREELEQVFEKDARIGRAFMKRISEVVGRRLLQMQALWARELQRTVEQEFGAPERSPG